MQKTMCESNDGSEVIRYEKTKMQKEQILRQLKGLGCRITKQRQILLDVILEESCSCCKEIYYKASLKDTGIGMATVYRMVNMLEKIGVISRRNMYRVTCGDTGYSDTSCSVSLSDHTVCYLTFDRWRDVMKAGLQECGYIADQEVELIEFHTAETK